MPSSSNTWGMPASRRANWMAHTGRTCSPARSIRTTAACRRRSRRWRRGSDARSVALLGTAAVLLCRCGPPALDVAPDPAETERLRAVLQAPPASGWTGAGHAQVAAPDGDFEGTLQAAVDAPHRAKIELVARALFGMVGERVVLSLPGDGNVLYYRERGDQLDRYPFSQSELARWTGCDSPVQLFALVEGRPPWPG